MIGKVGVAVALVLFVALATSHPAGPPKPHAPKDLVIRALQATNGTNGTPPTGSGGMNVNQAPPAYTFTGAEVRNLSYAVCDFFVMYADSCRTDEHCYLQSMDYEPDTTLYEFLGLLMAWKQNNTWAAMWW